MQDGTPRQVPGHRSDPHGDRRIAQCLQRSGPARPPDGAVRPWL